MNYVVTVLSTHGREHRIEFANREAAARCAARFTYAGFTAWVARA